MVIHCQKITFYNMEILFNSKPNDTEQGLEELNSFFNRENSLKDLKVDEIVDIFDHISKFLTSKQCDVKDLIIENDLGFIILWLKKKSITKNLKLNFEDYTVLDNPQALDNENLIYARPLGCAVHWIAGNVPVLGVISLFQTLLTKNKGVVKVPAVFKEILPKILNSIKQTSYFNEDISKKINYMLDAIIVIYITKDNKEMQTYISQNADIRIAWGGLEAMEEISSLPKKINTRDIIFGPKLSLSYITKKAINPIELNEIAKGIADDVFAFNQAGCNAPHNIVIKNKIDFPLNDFCHSLTEEFSKKAKTSPIKNDEITNFNILTKKFIHQSQEALDLLQGPDNQWNIFMNNKELKQLEPPLYSRNIFISFIDSTLDLGKILPSNVQSVGLLTDEVEKLETIKILSNFGVDRFPSIGKMSLYQNPWDGYLPLHQTVKWISTN